MFCLLLEFRPLGLPLVSTSTCFLEAMWTWTVASELQNENWACCCSLRAFSVVDSVMSSSILFVYVKLRIPLLAVNTRLVHVNTSSSSLTLIGWFACQLSVRCSSQSCCCNSWVELLWFWSPPKRYHNDFITRNFYVLPATLTWTIYPKCC